MTNDDLSKEEERARRLWELEAKRSDSDDDWGQPVSAFTPLFAMPTKEEREAFDNWLSEAYADAYGEYSEGELLLEFEFRLFEYAKNLAIKYRDDLCRIYANVRPITDSDYVTVTIIIVDFLFAIGLSTPFSVGSIAFLIVRRGMLDKICPNAKRQTI